MKRIATELRQPAKEWGVTAYQAMSALSEGRFEAAEELIEEAVGEDRANHAAMLVLTSSALFSGRAGAHLAGLANGSPPEADYRSIACFSKAPPGVAVYRSLDVSQATRAVTVSKHGGPWA